jgi:lipopolysaccharide/colanic/teichoic acid biosynthesis glycosyltransferase
VAVGAAGAAWTTTRVLDGVPGLAAAVLAGVLAAVLGLRWLRPLPEDDARWIEARAGGPGRAGLGQAVRFLTGGARAGPPQGTKRAIDVVGALLSLVVAGPVIAVLALAVTAGAPGPALFRQERVGRGGRPFLVIKLRTMQVDAEEVLAADPALHRQYLAHGYKLPVRLDPRVTRLGRWLRLTELDELPQLWNVLRGDMSLVGPRPVLAEELPLYGDDRAAYESVRPGITGLWQVRGRTSVSYPERVALDRRYASEASLALDARIVLRTIAGLPRRMRRARAEGAGR